MILVNPRFTEEIIKVIGHMAVEEGVSRKKMVEMLVGEALANRSSQRGNSESDVDVPYHSSQPTLQSPDPSDT